MKNPDRTSSQSPPTMEDFQTRVAPPTSLLAKMNMTPTDSQATTPALVPVPPPTSVPTSRFRLPVPEEFDGDTSTLMTVNLGNLYKSQGKLDEAEKMYRRALQGYEKALGPDRTPTLMTVNNLGSLYADQGKLDEAEEMYQRVLQGYEKALGPDHTSTLNTVNNLGNLYKSQGKLDEAEKMYQRALQGKRILGREHPDTLSAVKNLADSYSDLGRKQEAMELRDRCQPAIVTTRLLDSISDGIQKSLSTWQTSTVSFEVHWELEEYIDKELYGSRDLDLALTVSGSAENAYATTCGAYLRWLWPDSKFDILKILEKVFTPEFANSDLDGMNHFCCSYHPFYHAYE